jgi:NAD-dependent SIR2 family protein deacetylase
MSTFSTPGGLYERAARAAQLPPGDGKKLFSWSFYERRRADALAFLADVAAEAAAAVPTPAHAALAALARTGALLRHFSLNIDGLHRDAGMDTWHPEESPDGCTVELHGCVREVVCPDCGRVRPADGEFLAAARARSPLPCPDCTAGPLRPRVLLYGDAEDGVITPAAALDLLEECAAAADLVLWVGLSFEQSATAAYFRDVRRALDAAGRGPRGGEGGEGTTTATLPAAVQAIVNPAAADAAFNLASACHYADEVGVLEVAAPADAALPALVAAIAAGVGRPDALLPAAAAAPASVPRRASDHGTLAASPSASARQTGEEEGGPGWAGRLFSAATVEGGGAQAGVAAEAGAAPPKEAGGAATALVADARVASPA